MRLRRVLPVLASAAVAVLASGAAVAVATPAAPAIPANSSQGTYFPSTPQRIFDSRSGGRLGQGRTVVVAPKVAGVTPSAVVVNLTVVNPTTSGYLTAYPTGVARPVTSSINFAAGRTLANLVTVPVGADGRFVVYNGLGTTDVVVDQFGVYSENNDALSNGHGRGGGFQPTAAQRVLDTRGDGGGQLPGGYYTTVPVRYDESGAQIAALAVNITVTNTRASGYVTAWDGATNQPPRTSTLNFARGTTVANSAIVPTSECTSSACEGDSAQIGILNGSAGGLDVIVDVVGFFDDGSLAAPVRYVPLATPVRVVDSRSGLGVGRLGPGATQAFTPPSSVAGTTTVGLDANVTVVNPTASTYLTLWPQLANYPRPRTSTVNSGARQVVSNHAIQEVGTGRRVDVYNFNGSTDVVVDVSGTFELIATDGAQRAIPRPSLTVLAPTTPRPAATA